MCTHITVKVINQYHEEGVCGIEHLLAAKVPHLQMRVNTKSAKAKAIKSCQ